MDSLETVMNDYFQTNDLPAPFVPTGLLSQLERVAEGVFGTRQDVPPLYNINDFVDEVTAQPIADYMMVGQDGYGVNSYAMHYYVVLEGVALFLQLGWGGAYGDKEKAQEQVGYGFTVVVEQVLTAVKEARLAGHISTDERLIVQVSSFYGSWWCWRNYTEPLDSVEWDELMLFPDKILQSIAKRAEKKEK